MVGCWSDMEKRKEGWMIWAWQDGIEGGGEVGGETPAFRGGGLRNKKIVGGAEM